LNSLLSFLYYSSLHCYIITQQLHLCFDISQSEPGRSIAGVLCYLCWV
jgi:hypothetical protein